MTLVGDYVIALSAGVIVASVVILISLLSRYSKLVQEADESARLAKDVWDSMNSRFSVVDTRIIDLMAKTEVLTSKSSLSQVAQSGASISTPVSLPVAASKSLAPLKSAAAMPISAHEGTETEARVLRMLADGPKTSAQIKDEVGKSREHTARLMKVLFERGLVARNDRNKPYVYEITDSGKAYVAS